MPGVDALTIEIKAKDFASTTIEKIQQKMRNLQKTGEKMQAIGKKFMLIGGAITGAFALPAKAAMDFEQGLARVSTMTDMTVARIKEKLGPSILSLSNRLAQSTGVINNAAYQALSAGVKFKDLTEFLEIAGKSAIAGGTDIETAVDGLTSALNSYGMSAREVAKVSDWMFTAVKAGKTTFPEIASAIGNVAPIASKAGISLQEILSAMAELTKQGKTTSEAFTGIRAMIQALINPTDETKKAFEELGINIDSDTLKTKGLTGTLRMIQKAFKDNNVPMAKQNELLGDIFGRIEGLTAALGLSGDKMKEWQQINEDMNNSIGATDEAFKKMSDTTSFRTKQMVEELKNLGIIIGSQVLPQVNRFLNRIIDITKRITDWMKAHQKLTNFLTDAVLKFGVAMLALGAGMFTIGKIITLFKSLSLAIKGVSSAITFLGANPYIMVIAAIITGGYLIWKYWDQIRRLFEAIPEVVKKVWESFKAYLIDNLNRAREAWSSFSGFINKTIEDLGVKKFIEATVTTIREKITDVLDDLNKIKDKIIDLRSNALKWGTDFISNLSNGISTKIRPVLDILNTIKVPILNLVDNALSWGLKFASAFTEGIRNKFKSVTIALGKEMDEFVRKALQWGQDFMDYFIQGLNFRLKPLYDFFDKIGLDRVLGMNLPSVPKPVILATGNLGGGLSLTPSINIPPPSRTPESPVFLPKIPGQKNVKQDLKLYITNHINIKTNNPDEVAKAIQEKTGWERIGVQILNRLNPANSEDEEDEIKLQYWGRP